METIYEEKLVKYATKYIAKDGKEFDSESSCKNHEKYLDITEAIKNIPHFCYDIENFVDWFYISSKSDYDSVIDFMALNGSVNEKYYVYKNEIGWYGFSFEYKNDYADEIGYISFDEIKKQYSGFVKMIESIEVKNKQGKDNE